jgi:predicted nucleic acid-binding protein
VLVIDASAAVYAATSERGFGFLTPFEPVAPPLMWTEAASVLHEGAWRGVVSDELTIAARDRLFDAPVARREPRQLLAEAWRIADELGWAKIYDAEYVALARLLSCRLFTVDERLQRGAGRLVEIAGPREL